MRKCRKCGARMAEYLPDDTVFLGRYFYCSNYPYDHPWVHLDRELMERIVE